MTSIVKHYKIQKDGSLKFIGIETTAVEVRPARPTRGPVIDNETMLKIGDIAYDGRINPDVRPQDDPDTRKKRIDRAKHLVMRKRPECLRTFWLIIRNGKNRKESIWQLMKNKASK